MKREQTMMIGNSTTLSRRRFLGCGAALAAAVASPHVIPAGVLAATGRAGANDRIRVGAIGVGRQGSRILQATAACKDVQVVAVADIHLPRARQIAGPWNAEPYQDDRTLLDRKDIDAVVTATPDHWHALICIHVCQAGKDIYSEKPMSLTIREGRLMVQAARKYDRVYQSGSMRRSAAVNRIACALIRDGGIGRIKRVIAHNYPSPWLCALPAQPVPEGLDWDAWCGATEVVPYHQDLFSPRAHPGWMSFRPYSGGEMTNWGAHGLDQVQWALGMDHGGPAAVWTEGEKFAPVTYSAPESVDRGDKACSQPKVFFQYPNDIVVELTDGPEGGAIFVGEKGTSERAAAVAADVRAAGFDLYGAGVMGMTDRAEVDRMFELAKAAKLQIIVARPTPEMLPVVNEKVQQYDIGVAIHNHGPGDDLYPTPDAAYEKIKGLDRRVGVCMDVGHAVRAGADPCRAAEQFADRILDVHMKDVSAATAHGVEVEVGRGVIDIPRFLGTLVNTRYSGVVSFEFANEAGDPLPGLAESVGYVRGVLAMIPDHARRGPSR